MIQKKNKSPNAVWHNATVTREMREQRHGHRGTVLWFTGLSGAGKSTIAHALEERLHAESIESFVLDGDNIRHGLCGDLGFTELDRHENIRRIGEVAKLFCESGSIVMCAFISPYQKDREKLKELIGVDRFIEVYCEASLSACERRDVKGLYNKARSGQIKNYTGISAPYEPPETPNLILNTEQHNLDECVDLVMSFLQSVGIFR